MILEDIIYGHYEVDGVLSELIASAPVQRLKGIHQGGAIFLVDPTQQHTRYEHSLGVMWLVRNFGGSTDEQIAALLHDVSHTAFSHVSDQVFDHPDEDYHEQIFHKVIDNSEVPAILAKHGYDQALNHFDLYTLLEQPLPGLCADRVDYTLRNLYHAGMIGMTDIQHFLSTVNVENGRMVLTDEASARWMSMQYKKLNDEYFKKPEYLFGNQRMAQVLKSALDGSLISAQDMLRDDEAVLAKLRLNGYDKELNDVCELIGFEYFAIKGAAERIKRRELYPAVMGS